MGRINTHAFGALYTLYTQESLAAVYVGISVMIIEPPRSAGRSLAERAGGRPRERREDIVTFYSKVSGELEGARLSPPRVWFQIPWCPCIYA